MCGLIHLESNGLTLVQSAVATRVDHAAQIVLLDRVCGRWTLPKAICIKQALQPDFSLQFFFAKEVIRICHQCG